MTATATPEQPETNAHDDHDHDHPSFLAHHFETPEQQFDSGKLGIWIFLVTEVLFFSGLFVAYICYRVSNPEVFKYAHHFLSKQLGGINTAVLLFSSLTMAWAVRSAQLGNRSNLIRTLGITLFCAAMFLGVKSFEYTEKFYKHLLWTGAFYEASELNKSAPKGSTASHIFNYENKGDTDTSKWSEKTEATLGSFLMFWWVIGIVPLGMTFYGIWSGKKLFHSLGVCGLICVGGMIVGIMTGLAYHHYDHASHAKEHADTEHKEGEHAKEGDTHQKGEKENTPDNVAAKDNEHKPAHDIKADHTHEKKPKTETKLGSLPIADPANDFVVAKEEGHGKKPRNHTIFFSIYYFMTGLHAFHILCGMIALSWLIVRAYNDEFNPLYFGPVDYVGLYWHLVDLIWIYLFPLLYLIK